MKAWEKAMWENMGRREDTVISEGRNKAPVGWKEARALSFHGDVQRETSTSGALNLGEHWGTSVAKGKMSSKLTDLQPFV